VTRRATGDRGSMTAFVAVAAVALVMVAGMAYDGGQVVSATAQARSDAAKAARAGAQEVGCGGACHGPGPTRKPLESGREFAELWDTVLDVSRAGWEREIRRIAQQIWRKSRQARGAGA